MNDLLKSLKPDASFYVALLSYAIMHGLFLGSPIVGFCMYGFTAAVIWLFKRDSMLGAWARLTVIAYGAVFVVLAIGLGLIRFGLL